MAKRKFKLEIDQPKWAIFTELVTQPGVYDSRRDALKTLRERYGADLVLRRLRRKKEGARFTFEVLPRWGADETLLVGYATGHHERVNAWEAYKAGLVIKEYITGRIRPAKESELAQEDKN